MHRLTKLGARVVMIGALIVLLLAGGLFISEVQSVRALQQSVRALVTDLIPAPLWNFYVGTKVRYNASGKITRISPTNREFVLDDAWVIAIEPSKQQLFRDGLYKVGDQVSVHLGWRYDHHYLRDIEFTK